MKILWLCSVPLPQISKALSKPVYNNAGWISGLFESLISTEYLEITICFPIKGENELIEGKVDNIEYYGFPVNRKTNSYNTKDLETVIRRVNPDILHVFGTENPFSLSMIKIFNNPNKTIINIQGLVSVIAKHFQSGIPFNVFYRFTLRDVVKRHNIYLEKRLFEQKGKLELEAIKNSNNIVGRTDWDKACTLQTNPKASYYRVNETLRSTFYMEEWNLNSCNKFTIFVSQAMYPIKGIHFVIEALSIIVKKYPDTHLYVAGSTIRIDKTDIKNKMMMTSYAKYVNKLISNYGLEKHITFTGLLNEKEMCQRFLKSHVFVSASTLENESNSLSEAKLLGVPSIASFVGGVTDRINHKFDGFLYQHDAPYMLAHYVCEVFGDDDLANKISVNARKNALQINDITKNKDDMVNVYRVVSKK